MPKNPIPVKARADGDGMGGDDDSWSHFHKIDQRGHPKPPVAEILSKEIM
jgi:hypothetical protein